MADTVRYLMEEMIPELEELEKKGYFSRSEIRQIVQKRQDFEYALKRRATLKKDFLRCAGRDGCSILLSGVGARAMQGCSAGGRHAGALRAGFAA